MPARKRAQMNPQAHTHMRALNAGTHACALCARDVELLEVREELRAVARHERRRALRQQPHGDGRVLEVRDDPATRSVSPHHIGICPRYTLIYAYGIGS